MYRTARRGVACRAGAGAPSGSSLPGTGSRPAAPARSGWTARGLLEGARRRRRGGTMAKRVDKAGKGEADRNLGGVLRSLGGFVDLLSRIAEEGGDFKRSGEIDTRKDGMKAVYGFSVRLGGASGPRVEPFGNV